MHERPLGYLKATNSFYYAELSITFQLSTSRRFRVLNIVDDYSREVVGQLVSASISGTRVARFLDELSETRSYDLRKLKLSLANEAY